MSEATQKPRTMLHVQVSGNPSPADLQNIAELFSNAIHDKNGSVVTTPDNVSLTALEVPADQPVVPIQVVSVIGPEVIAEMTYEVNRAYCKGIGDNSFPNDWANADEHQKAVNRAGVQNHLRNPGLTPQQSHQAWMQSKIQDGWTYGPVKDAEKKTHPAMVPYEGLPPEQKTKDFLFKAVVDVLRSRLPAPSLVQREVEVYIGATGQWVPGNFMELQINYIWRFKEQPDVKYLAQSTPYVNYTDRGTAYTIDAQQVKFDHEDAVNAEELKNDSEQTYDEVIEEHADEPSGEPRDPDFDGRTDSTGD